MRFFAPEVIQTSAMDCGPATLKCLLEGHGVPVSYGRLREACQTDVDGTSIDTMEEVANQLGLVAEQVMVPADHVLLPESKALPAILVIRNPSGMTHFIVIWRRHGRLVQVMDPALGRRWVSLDQLLADFYIHTMPVAAEAWRAWAGTAEHLDPLKARLRNLGCTGRDISRRVQEALLDPTWGGLALLDAATRMVEALVAAGAVAQGKEAPRLLAATCQETQAQQADAEGVIPRTYWSVWPAAPDADGTPQLVLRGAVLVRVVAQTERPQAAHLSPELAAALQEPPARPGRDLLRLLRADGLMTPFVLAALTFVAALGVILEALLFRGLFDLGHALTLPGQRVAAMGVLLAFLAAVLLIRWPVAAAVWRMGRRLEVRLRIAFLEKIPRLSDRYFQSRPVSDMADRSHRVHRLREVPVLGSRLVQGVFELVLTAAGVIWLAPASAPWAVAAAVLALAWPLATQPALGERDLRVQTHAGALGRFYLDALLGLVAVRTHGAERSVRREHEGLLVAWAAAGLRLQRTRVGVEAVQLFTGFGLAAWLLFAHLGAGGNVGTVLLLVYWALNLPVLGQEVALLMYQYPTLRTTTLRLMEPLGALEADTPSATDAVLSLKPQAAAVQLSGVSVMAAGHTLLDGVDLDVTPGEHVAIVGASGAGKSTLVGLLLGWHRPAKGTLRVDGQALDGEHLVALRRHTVWVDPAVQLWNAPLLDNLRYATDPDAPLPMAALLEGADLRDVLKTLPDGLQTPLGEGGGRVSGGEGQRVRLGRGLAQAQPRLVILDEPFRGLDRTTRQRLLAQARQHWQHATLLCITHDVADTDVFPRVVVVEAGAVVEDAAPSTLLRRPSRYRALVEREGAVRERLWGHRGWRRLFLSGGRLTERLRRKPVPESTALPVFKKLIHYLPAQQADAEPLRPDVGHRRPR